MHNTSSTPSTSSTAQRIREHRLERGLTQQELADELTKIAWLNKSKSIGVTANMVSKWERGTKYPSPFYRELLPLVLDVDAPELGLPTRAMLGGRCEAGRSQDTVRRQEPDDVDRRQFLRSTAAVGVTLLGPLRCRAIALCAGPDGNPADRNHGRPGSRSQAGH